MKLTPDHFLNPVPEDSPLGKIDRDLSVDSVAFLRQQQAQPLAAMSELQRNFDGYAISETGTTVSQHTEAVLSQLALHATNTAAPKFIGHMTSALPQFLLPLSKLMVALNQNVVKIETSDVLTPLEQEVIAMMHHLTYQNEGRYYALHRRNGSGALGVFCSGGTVANITALWNARNLLFPAEHGFGGVAQEGMAAALMHHGYKGAAVLVSRRGHYSLAKTADLLGLGREHFVAVDTDAHNRINTLALEKKLLELERKSIKALAIVGIAGTTETGNVDPLSTLADIAEQHQVYFHVDAAWGGATLMSRQHRTLLQGVERADSVTIDAHKQMYVPMGAGMVLFKNPETASAIEHHANYILREGSGDLGRHTLEGSRPAMAMLVHACLGILGRQGYEQLIDNSLQTARDFAGMINDHTDFQLVSEPELCLLTYRFVPAAVQALLATCSPEKADSINVILNALTVDIQRAQRDAGKSFVSRTQLQSHGRHENAQPVIVFRVVLANPLTTHQDLQEILEEQAQIAATFLPQLEAQLDLASPDPDAHDDERRAS